MLTFYLNLIENETEKRQIEDIYFTYKNQMYLLAQKILNNKHDAEDVVHDIFCSIASSHMDIIMNAATPDDVRNYLLKSVKNASISLIRKRKIRSDYEDRKRKEKCELSDNIFIDKVCEKFEFERFIKLLGIFDKKYREVLYYHLVLDLSVNETAEILGKAPNTVRQQIARGKNSVATYLRRDEKLNGNDKR